MTHIALCDDDKNAVSVLAGAVISAFEANGFQIQLDFFTSGKALLSSLAGSSYDLVLLDINMPGLDGIEVGRQVKAIDHTIPVVFVSECEERVFEAFSVQPLCFVRKSNFVDDITGAVELYRKYREMTRSAEHVEFAGKTNLVSLKVAQIRYMESDHNYQMVHVTDQEKPIAVKMTMENMGEKMKPYGFLRIHKGYLVNYRFIRRIGSSQVTLIDGTGLPVGRSKAPVLRNQYLALLS